MRIPVIVALTILPLAAQLPSNIPADLRFEAASLKQSPPGSTSEEYVRPAAGGARYEAVNCPLATLLQVAFRVRPEQISGIPAWLDSQRFDMQAKAPKPSSADELHVMLVNLLADRLHLQYHVGKKEMQIYALLAPKGDAKLSRRETSSGDSWVDLKGNDPLVTIVGTNARMDFLAFRLSNEGSDRPVIDMTGLRDSYDFEVTYRRERPRNLPEDGKADSENPDPPGLNLSDALKQQLGLELKPQKGPAPVVVVDHAQRLEEN